MALSREITLTIDNYNIILDKEIKIYEYDAINLCFTIQECGIVMRDGKAHNRVMPVVALKAYMLIETPQGTDSVEATNIVRNKIMFSLGNKYSRFVGTGKMQIILKDFDGCRITLPEFTYEVKQSINTGWDDGSFDVLITEKEDTIITDELGRPVETTKISEFDETNEITPQTYTMVINEDGNKKIKLDTIMESVSEMIEFDVEEIDRKIDEMIEVYDDEEVEVEFPSLHNDVERIKGEINEISESLDNIEDEKATRQEVDVERKRINDIKSSLDNMESRINDIENGESNGINLPYIEPPFQPNTWANIDTNYDIKSTNVYNLYDDMLSDNFTKTLLGKDTSNTYDIYRYIYTPKSYKHTIVLHAGMHGYEETAIFALYRFMYHVIKDTANIESLEYIKNKVRIIIIPIINPWGFNQNPRKYGTVTGTNPSRNFDYNWSSYVSDGSEWDKKGASAFSEKETQYMRDTYLEFKDSIDFCYDLHTGRDWNKEPFIYFVNSDDVLRPKILKAIDEYFTPRIISKGRTPKPEVLEAERALNLYWLNKVQGIPSVTIEFATPNIYGNTVCGEGELTEYVHNIINYVVCGLNREGDDNDNDNDNLATKEDIDDINNRINTINSDIPFSFTRISRSVYDSLPGKIGNKVYFVENYGLFIGTTCIISINNQNGGGSEIDPIITDGLIQNLVFNTENITNKVVNDLSGNGNNAILNGDNFTVEANSLKSVDGNSYINTNVKIFEENSSFTYEIGIKYNIISAHSQYFFNQCDRTMNEKFIFGVLSNGNAFIEDNNSIILNEPISEPNIINKIAIVGVLNSDNFDIKIYVNNILKKECRTNYNANLLNYTISMLNLGNTNHANNLKRGCDCNIYYSRLYNRALTEYELTHNFNHS